MATSGVGDTVVSRRADAGPAPARCAFGHDHSRPDRCGLRSPDEEHDGLGGRGPTLGAAAVRSDLVVVLAGAAGVAAAVLV
jgi:hypothetical protein